ncbi:SMI1/KNR4 family protein [Amycolatopsis sp. NPDC059657]|uniref:SMI1/KNR4 family protein n=1 Tax=Amycolatopsis sp. NPDC059657 TaxID=3346899 RepID=UPI00367036D1
MSQMSPDSLVDRIVRASQWRGASQPGRDWSTVESVLGTALPSDYKLLMSRFPSGTYRDIIWVANPIDARTDLGEFARREVEEVLGVIGHEEMTYLDGTSYRLFPEEGGLLPWGDDGQGGWFCWITSSADPDQWRVTYYDDGMDEWRERDGPVSRIIWEVMTRDDDNIMHWDLGDRPAVFRVPSTYAGDGEWIPHPEYE